MSEALIMRFPSRVPALSSYFERDPCLLGALVSVQSAWCS